ncbi:phosphonate C-P lyase system protein PhnG [Guggenheimella bovis]
MTRTERTRILIEGRRELSGEMSRTIRHLYQVREIQPPKGSLVMLKVREHGKGGLFYLGEVFVMECKMLLQEKVGLGIVRGSDEQLARDLAIIDAAYKAGIDLSSFDERLEKERQHIEGERERESANILRTEVDFSTMEAMDE